MNQPPPHRPPQPPARRPVRPRLGYLILAVLALPMVLGGGALVLIILLGSHTTDSSGTRPQPSLSTFSTPANPPPIPSPHSCYPFQPNCVRYEAPNYPLEV
ncbi:hypothetical protein GL305_16740, partial [Nocardia seriolae]|nr:hypothetical protein [Nocardia seriolae]MTL13155.1 hypothetical protein [Nocardia seriolae]